MTPSLLAMAWLTSKAQWFWNHRPELRFGWIALILTGYLVWESTATVPKIRERVTPINASLAFAGLAVLFLCQVYIAAFGTMPAVVAGLAAGTLLIVAANLHFLFGVAGWRRFGFPFLFFLTSLPLPSLVQNPLVSTLQSIVTRIDIELLNLIGVPAARAGNLIQVPSGVLDIDAACSGVRSLQSTFMTALFIGGVAMRQAWTRAVLLAGALASAIAGNVLRSFYLGWLTGTRGWEAARAQHDPAGWMILGLTLALTIALAGALKHFESTGVHGRRKRKNVAATGGRTVATF